MRIYNADTDKNMDSIILYLTPDEAKEMKDSLEVLLKNEKYHHVHVPDSDFKKEITICIYIENKLSDFDERSKKIILENQ